MCLLLTDRLYGLQACDLGCCQLPLLLLVHRLMFSLALCIAIIVTYNTQLDSWCLSVCTFLVFDSSFASICLLLIQYHVDSS